MKEICLIFDEINTNNSLHHHEGIKSFANDFEGFSFTDDTELRGDDKSLLYYLAGYIAKQKCNKCNEILSSGIVPMFVSFENIKSNADPIESKAEEVFITAISRRSLT